MSLSIKFWKKNSQSYIKLLENTENFPSPYTHIIVPTLNKLIKRYSTKTSKIIDLGCGEGFLTRQIKPLRPKIVGCDISKEMVASAQKQSPNISYWVENIEHLKSIRPQKDYSLAFSTLVFHYLEHIDTALTKIHRLLTDKGIFIVIIPHPCYYQQQNFDWFQAENSASYNLGDYFTEETTIRNIAHKYQTHHIHRTIGSYIRIFQQHHFNCLDILEPLPISAPTKVLDKATHVPFLAFFVLQKN